MAPMTDSVNVASPVKGNVRNTTNENKLEQSNVKPGTENITMAKNGGVEPNQSRRSSVSDDVSIPQFDSLKLFFPVIHFLWSFLCPQFGKTDDDKNCGGNGHASFSARMPI